MTRIEHAVILAAGRGQRMMPLTETVPKALASYRGTPLVGHSIAKLKEHVKYTHVTVGYRSADVAKYLLEVGVTSIINTEGCGNAWWLFNSPLRYADKPVLVLTCDNVADIDIEALELDYAGLGSPACMLVPVKPIPGITGDYVHHDDARRVTELSRTNKAPTYASGIQVLNPMVVNWTIEGERVGDVDDFETVWETLINRGCLKVSSVCPKQWFSVDTVGDLERLNRQAP